MDVFDLEQILNRTAVAQIEYHDRLDSTNDCAINLIKNGNPDLPLLVLTEKQAAGRGQGNRKWLAGKGSLTCSVCLPSHSAGAPRPELTIAPGVESLMPLATALTVCRTLETLTTLVAQIKWPNDVLIARQKVGGILIEKVAVHAKTVLVIGIGVNANNSIRSDQLSQIDPPDSHWVIEPTSIITLTGSAVDLQNFLIRLLCEFAETVGQLHQNPESIVRLARDRLVLLDRQVRLILPGGKEASGKCVGLGPGGELLIESNGKIHRMSSGRLARPD